MIETLLLLKRNFPGKVLKILVNLAKLKINSDKLNIKRLKREKKVGDKLNDNFMMYEWSAGEFSACRDSSCAKSSPPSRALTRTRPKDPCMAWRRTRAAGKVPCRACKRLKKKRRKDEKIEEVW